MNLREHMTILALDPLELAIAVGGETSQGIIERAMDGQVIPAEDARRIALYIGRRFGHPTIGAPYEVDGLITVGLSRTDGDD